MGHDRPDHPSISSQEKEELSPPPLNPDIILDFENYIKTLEKKVGFLTTQYNNFRMGTSLAAVVLINAVASAFIEVGLGVLLLGLAELVLLLFIAHVLDIVFITKHLKEIWNKILSPPD